MRDLARPCGTSRWVSQRWDQFEQVVSDVFKFVVSKYADDGESTGCVHSLDCRDAFEEGGLLGICYGSAGTKIKVSRHGSEEFDAVDGEYINSD